MENIIFLEFIKLVYNVISANKIYEMFYIALLNFYLCRVIKHLNLVTSDILMRVALVLSFV